MDSYGAYFKNNQDKDYYEKKIYDQSQLIQISKALNSNLDLSFLIEAVLNITITHSTSFTAGILMLSKNGSDFSFGNAHIGLNAKIARPLRIATSDPLLKFLSAEKKSFRLQDLKKEKNLSATKEIKKSLNKLEKIHPNPLLVPSLFRNNLMAVLFLGNKQNGSNYTADEIEFLSDVGNIAAIAINNARLYYLATVDGMTGLKIHHFFQAKLQENLEHAKHDNAPLSIIMLDIDFFKKFNDEHGHQAGDFVLEKVGQVLQKSCKGKAICCRYGGEEFAIILSDINLIMAEKFAEKLRIAIKNLRLRFKNKNLQITVSIGVAQYNPNIDQNKNVLIERCDKALYKAKNNGRNRVEKSIVNV